MSQKALHQMAQEATTSQKHLNIEISRGCQSRGMMSCLQAKPYLSSPSGLPKWILSYAGALAATWFRWILIWIPPALGQDSSCSFSQACMASWYFAFYSFGNVWAVSKNLSGSRKRNSWVLKHLQISTILVFIYKLNLKNRPNDNSSEEHLTQQDLC